MKNIKRFNELNENLNENESQLNGLAPVWLNNVLKELSGYKVYSSEYGDAILTVNHIDTRNVKALDITVIFAIDGIDVSMNWTWGQDEEDIKKMAKIKISDDNINQDVKRPEPGNGPKDYVFDVMRFIADVEEKRRED